ncbi:MAG TPA: hypothetical protein VJS65_07410 [Verrucomicrobiae bacterium]|nr:hypothetical protein [Verrucomicrobiae bacterium]
MIHKLLLTAFVCTSFAVAVRADDERPPVLTPPPSPSRQTPPPALTPSPSPSPQAPTQRRNKGQLSEEQRNLMIELRAKYDTNKDGKLDDAERKVMTAEDKDRMAKAGFIARKKREKDDN